MNKIRLKKIIAREGLIALNTFVLGAILALIGYLILPEAAKVVFNSYDYKTLFRSTEEIRTKIGVRINAIGWCIFALYPVYLILRIVLALKHFIVWAIRTLKEKDNKIYQKRHSKTSRNIGRKILYVILGISGIFIACFGLYRLIYKGITSFRTKDIAGITFIVGLIIYFICRVVKGYRKI